MVQSMKMILLEFQEKFAGGKLVRAADIKLLVPVSLNV